MSIFAPDGKLARCLNCIGNLMILNILTLICCIPLVTAGAAMTALYTMTMRMARNEEGSIVREYFQAFRENFKQATILWLIFGSLMVFLAFDIYILRSGIPDSAFCDPSGFRDGVHSHLRGTGPV